MGLTGAYLHPIPNAQPLDLVVFSAGALLGARDGSLVATLTMLTYSLFNPYGPAHPLVVASQVIGEAAFAVTGGLLARGGLGRDPAAVRLLVLGVAALLLTVFYDLITNLATGLLFGRMKLVLIGGIPFALVHTGVNIALFCAVGTPLVAVFARFRERLST